MLSPTTTKTTSKVETPTAKKNKYKPCSAGLNPATAWCDHCGKKWHSREKCWRLHGHSDTGTTNDNKGPFNQKANITESTQQLSSEDLQAVRRLLSTSS